VQTHSTTLQGAEGGSRFTFSQKEALRMANRSGVGSRPTDLDKAKSIKRFSNTSTIPLALTALLSLSILNGAHADLPPQLTPNPPPPSFLPPPPPPPPPSVAQSLWNWIAEHVGYNEGMVNDESDTHIVTVTSPDKSSLAEPQNSPPPQKMD